MEKVISGRSDADTKERKKIMRIKTTNKCATKKVVAKKVAKTCTSKCAAAKPATKSVTFTVHAEKGKSVYLAGDFNDWNPSAKKMAFKGGVYSASVALTPGEHQYKFVIDGIWCADPENSCSVANDQGTFNSVVDVK